MPFVSIFEDTIVCILYWNLSIWSIFSIFVFVREIDEVYYTVKLFYNVFHKMFLQNVTLWLQFV